MQTIEIDLRNRIHVVEDHHDDSNEDRLLAGKKDFISNHDNNASCIIAALKLSAFDDSGGDSSPIRLTTCDEQQQEEDDGDDGGLLFDCSTDYCSSVFASTLYKSWDQTLYFNVDEVDNNSIRDSSLMDNRHIVIVTPEKKLPNQGLVHSNSDDYYIRYNNSIMTATPPSSADATDVKLSRTTSNIIEKRSTTILDKNVKVKVRAASTGLLEYQSQSKNQLIKSTNDSRDFGYNIISNATFEDCTLFQFYQFMIQPKYTQIYHKIKRGDQDVQIAITKYPALRQQSMKALHHLNTDNHLLNNCSNLINHRQVNFVTPMQSFLGKMMAHVQKDEWFYFYNIDFDDFDQEGKLFTGFNSNKGSEIVIMKETRVTGIPYSESFYLKERWSARRCSDDDHGIQSIVVSIKLEILFDDNFNSAVRGVIERRTKSSFKESCSEWLDYARLTMNRIESLSQDANDLSTRHIQKLVQDLDNEEVSMHSSSFSTDEEDRCEDGLLEGVELALRCYRSGILESVVFV